MSKSSNMTSTSRKKNFSKRVYNLFSKISRGFKENKDADNLNSKLIKDLLDPIALYFIIPIMLKLVSVSDSPWQLKKSNILKELKNIGFDISQAQSLLSNNIPEIDNYEIYIQKLKLLCNDNQAIYKKIIIALINLSTSNKPLLSIELSIIKHIASLLDISSNILDKLVAQALAYSEDIDPYFELEIDRNASQEELKTQYRMMAKKYHPDKYTQDNNISIEYKKSMESKFHAINKAYNKLKTN